MPIKILVVDDNRDTLRIYIKALSRRIKPKGCNHNLLSRENESLIKIEEADTVTNALEKLKSQSITILVVDLKIPGLSGEEMGGLDLISRSIHLDPLRPIIAITGFGSVALAKKTLTQGVFDFIEKSEKAVDDLIHSIQRAIDCRDEKIRRSGNPFTPMTSVDPTIFGGRTKELEFFEERLNRICHTRFCEHFLVHGNWGIGKSTLFSEYKKICQSRGYLASIVPLELLQAGTKQEDAARSIIEGILRSLPFPVERFKKIIRFFDSVGISILNTGFQFTRDTSEKKISPQAFLHDALLNLWEDLKDKTEVLVILLDDFDNFMATSEILMTLKQTLSMDLIRNTKILLGISSTPECWRSLTLIQKHHPLSRYFLSRIELSLLTEDELRETICKSLTTTGVVFDTDVIERVFEYTQGHPFEMQVICYHLFHNQLSRRVKTDIWEKALKATLKDMGIVIFEDWYNRASTEEVKVLHAIAKSEISISTKKIQRLAENGEINVSPYNIAKYLQRLVEKKLISKCGRGLYTISDKIFRNYICTRLNG